MLQVINLLPFLIICDIISSKNLLHYNIVYNRKKMKIFVMNIIFEPWHEISNIVVCATSKGSDQPAHTQSDHRAFASPFSIIRVSSYVLTEHHLEFLS